MYVCMQPQNVHVHSTLCMYVSVDDVCMFYGPSGCQAEALPWFMGYYSTAVACTRHSSSSDCIHIRHTTNNMSSCSLICIYTHKVHLLAHTYRGMNIWMFDIKKEREGGGNLGELIFCSEYITHGLCTGCVAY